MKDRFDLEQEILQCWNITDDINLLYRKYYDTDDMSKDDVANFLLGLTAIYNAKFDELFNTFETLVGDKKII